MKCIYHNFKNNNKFDCVPFFFNNARYLTLGTYNVLTIQTVCLTPLSIITHHKKSYNGSQQDAISFMDGRKKKKKHSLLIIILNKISKTVMRFWFYAYTSIITHHQKGNNGSQRDAISFMYPANTTH